MFVLLRIPWSRTKCLCPAAPTTTPTISCSGFALTPRLCRTSRASPRGWTVAACTTTLSPCWPSHPSSRTPTAGSWTSPWSPYGCRTRDTTCAKLREDAARRNSACFDTSPSKVSKKSNKHRDAHNTGMIQPNWSYFKFSSQHWGYTRVIAVRSWYLNARGTQLHLLTNAHAPRYPHPHLTQGAPGVFMEQICADRKHSRKTEG